MLTKDEAICIRAVDYSETSQIVTFFSRENGKISAIAKGSKRPKSAFGGTIELFSCGKVVFSDSNKQNLATLTEFEQQPDFPNLTCKFFILNCALFAAELLDRLTDEYDPHPLLFDSFLQFLQDVGSQKAICNKQRDALALVILFQLSLLKEAGLQPSLNTCINCKNKFTVDWPGTYFSSSANSLICRDCEASFPDKVKLTNTAASCLSNLKLIAESKEETLNEIENVLVYHFTELLGWRPKMAKYILEK